ncbi:hypothetical protein DM860_000687 [Cuscuta australis]|uniref:Uncharacterized protein n=1 Tax=Cuscuta australis TaxID=267555 RepID=A0A328D2A0_9ASTE|nr:hypothetical protein DM860_000687 [Cuscuta australis]
MVQYQLRITAELENLTNLQPQGGFDNPNFTYMFKLKCSCGEVTEKETCVSYNETVALPTGRGEAHLVQKCKFCTKTGNLTMVTGHGHPLTQEASESGSFTPAMVFDCRGFEPLQFHFGGAWQAESIEGTKFEGFELTDGEYSDYDEKGKCPVMISNLCAEFVRLPKELPLKPSAS